MTNQRPNRRQVLKGAGAVAATAALAKTTIASHGIVGSWLFTVTTNDGSMTKSLVTFDQRGTLMEAQQDDVGATTIASPGHGAWVKTGSDEFAMTIIKMAYETSGNATPRMDISTTNHRSSFTGDGAWAFCCISFSCC